jgi:hypothetical protein
MAPSEPGIHASMDWIRQPGRHSFEDCRPSFRLFSQIELQAERLLALRSRFGLAAVPDGQSVIPGVLPCPIWVMSITTI